MLICPVCGKELNTVNKAYICAEKHSFDIAKEGYVNLLRSGRDGDFIGDDKTSCRSRRDFLNEGYYSPLKDALCEIFADKKGSVVDICCGEGYYTSSLGQNTNLDVYGFDISKEMIRLASKRGNGTYFVSNMTSIPFKTESVDYATHLFAPFCDGEFARILKKGGELYTVIPGKRHLFGLKKALYESPYENDEKFPPCPSFDLAETVRVKADITLKTKEDINAVFRMTPYFFHTSEKDKQKLDGIASLDTEIEFIIGKLIKK